MDFRKEISNLGYRGENMDINTMAEHLMTLEHATFIDFIAFGKQHVEGLIKQGRTATASTYNRILGNLTDYFGTPKVNIFEITANMLVKYEAYLRSDRTMVRPGRGGNDLLIRRQGLSNAGIHAHMRDLRVLFNAAMAHFNDEDNGIVHIKHYPFKKYKIVPPPLPKKYKLSVDEVKKIKNIECTTGREELARDMFLLSFYLCGMNAKDIYKADPFPNSGRMEYNRSKTMRGGGTAHLSV